MDWTEHFFSPAKDWEQKLIKPYYSNFPFKSKLNTEVTQSKINTRIRITNKNNVR